MLFALGLPSAVFHLSISTNVITTPVLVSHVKKR